MKRLSRVVWVGVLALILLLGPSLLPQSATAQNGVSPTHQHLMLKYVYTSGMGTPVAVPKTALSTATATTTALYQERCFAVNTYNIAVLAGQDVWRWGYHYAWCAGTTTAYGPGIFQIYSHTSETDIYTFLYHYIYTWASAIGFQWRGLDSTGNGEFWLTWGGSTRGEIGVWNRAFIQQCPIRIGFCTDYYPTIHLYVYANGAYKAYTTIGN